MMSDRRVKYSSLPRLFIGVIVVLSTFACTHSSERNGSSTAKQQPEQAATTGLETVRVGTSLRREAAELTDAGEYSQASRLLHRAMRADPSDPATFYEFARLRWAEKNIEQAKVHIAKAMSLRPDDTLRKKLDELDTQLASGQEL